jgi:hypothetical protein
MRIDPYLALWGTAAGVGSAILFRWVSARVPRVDVWLPAAQLARSLVALEDDGAFLSRYGELLKLLIRYLGRQALTLALPCVVAASVAMLVLPSGQHSRDNLAPASESDREQPLLVLRASSRSLPPSPGSGPILPLAWNESEVVFVAFLCVGSALGMAPLPRKP